MGHSQIASLAEPWLMLPFSYAYKKQGIISEYSHSLSYDAFEDFIENLPNKEVDYHSSLRSFLLELYSKQCKNNELYFLDKTPRYYYIINEITNIFPDAKYIILLRNPVHVLSSAINTWSNGDLRREYFFYDDIHHAPKALADACKSLKDKALIIQYENFVQNPQATTKEICNYLDIKFEDGMIKEFTKQDTMGRHGDPTGAKEYKTISKKSLHKWKSSFTSRYMFNYLKAYIEELDRLDIFKSFDYDKKHIQNELNNINVNFGSSIPDKYKHFRSNMFRLLKPRLFRRGTTTGRWAKNKHLE
jgi:hypothetical protein